MKWEKQGVGKKADLKRWAEGKKITGHVKQYRIRKQGKKSALYIR